MNTRRLIPVLVALAIGLGSVAGGVRAADVATLSFAPAGERATFAGQLTTRDGRISVDLSVLPAGAPVHRAVLQVRRDPPVNVGRDPIGLKPIVIEDSAGRALALRGPRFASFDATAAVRDSLRKGEPLVLQVKAFPGWNAAGARLDVTLNAAPKAVIKPVSALRVTHRGGQTFITWKDPYPRLSKEAVTIQEWRRARTVADTEPVVRFRIYRSDKPIAAETVAQAELVDEVDGLTAWNGEYHGVYPKDDAPALRYVVWEGEGPVAPDADVYVHQPAEKGTAYYAVSAALDGEEDLRAPAASKAVAEAVGPGVPVLQRIEKPKAFVYVDDPTLRYYVKWESPPTCNLPSRPFDYLVAMPPKPKEPRTPLLIALHCWGANLNGGYGWWYGGRDGAMMVATNQIPYDWWACYHENLYTLKAFSEGVAHSYTPKRLWAFVDWVKTQWPVDEQRTFVGGSSMGGAGVSHWLRYGDRLAYGISWVGVHIPAKSPQFTGSYEEMMGRVEWRLPHESGPPAFEYADDAAWLRAHPEVETPLLAYANGKNDSGIGWPQAAEFTRALQETRRPHLFEWGQAGHGQRAYFPTPAGGGDNVQGGLDIRLDQSLPAFTRCSLDDAMGSGDPKDGEPAGQLNRYTRWKTDDLADEAGRYEITLYLIGQAPKDACSVDVTPRRLQRFKPKPGETLKWTNLSLPDRREVAAGSVVVDRWGLVTVPGLQVTKAGNRLMIAR